MLFCGIKLDYKGVLHLTYTYNCSHNVIEITGLRKLNSLHLAHTRSSIIHELKLVCMALLCRCLHMTLLMDKENGKNIISSIYEETEKNGTRKNKFYPKKKKNTYLLCLFAT
jgi:hypothetical protein